MGYESMTRGYLKMTYFKIFCGQNPEILKFLYYFTKGAHNFHLKKLKNFINKKCSLGSICITKFQYFQILREKKIGVCTSKKAKNAQKLTLHLKFLKIFVLKLYLILSVTF